jgi:hypothetical protein
MGKDIFKYKTKENIPFWNELHECFYQQYTILFEGDDIDKSYLLESFIDKFNIQKILDSNSVFGYEELIGKLRITREEKLKVINVYCEGCLYILIVDKKNNVLSVLKSNNSNIRKIKKYIETNEFYKSTDYLFFNKGIEM